MKTLVWIAVAVFVPGGGLLALAYWWRTRSLAQARAQSAREIKAPRVIFKDQDDSLRVKTAQRRQASDGMRARAARVETGSSVSDVLRMVGKR